jgi:hypothetical protein
VAVLSVVISFLVGAFLMYVPWTPLWETNYLLQVHATLRAFLLNAFTRGGVSGLGVVNVMLALHEARQLFASRARG